MRMGRSTGCVALAVAVGVATVIVGSSTGSGGVGGSPAAAGVSAGSDQLDLPPAGRDELAKLFDDQLRGLGLRTTRASIQLRPDYQQSTQGGHLAIYVEPIDPAGVSARRSVETIVPLARIFLPKVFRRWSDLGSFDVCQEPAADVDPSAVPPPITQVAVTRKAAAAIDWADASLDDLVARAASAGGDHEYGLGDPTRLYLFVGQEVADVGAYRRARRAAGLPAKAPTTTTTTPRTPPSTAPTG